MTAVGFDRTKGKGNGIKSMYNFRSERDLKKTSLTLEFHAAAPVATIGSKSHLWKNVTDSPEIFVNCGQSWK